MNILESLRKIENKIYREQDKSIDLQGMYLKEDVDKEKLWEMITNNDIDGVIKYLTEDLYTVKYYYYTDGDFTDRDIVDGEKTFTDAQEASQFSNSIKKAVGNNLIDLRWDIQDENTTRDWELIDRKTVHDWDGFTTDYTLWKKNGEDYWVCVFGDSDIYGPEDGDFDAEFDNEREALEWFRYYDDEYEQYHDGDIDESIDNKELKEAKLGPYKYRYEIRYTAPNGKDYLEGASNDIDKAENVALSGCDHWYESPWESDEHKADVISSYRIIDSDSNSSVETDRLPLYKNKLLKMLTKSKLKEDTNSSFEFRTKDLQSASKIASYIRNHFEVDPITDRDDSYEWYCIKAELTPDQKREARQFVKKFSGYILGENLKESMKGNDIELEMSSIKELIEWLETHPFDKVEDINIEVNNGRNSFSYYLYWSSPRVNVGSYPIVQIDRNDKTIFSKEGDELPTKESYKNFINETIDFLKNYTENFVENLKESSVVQAVNSFRRMLDRFNSNGKSAKSGDWRIAKGGYDLDFEVYHKGVPVIDCVNGELEILTDREKYLPIAKTITNIYKDTHLSENLKESVYTENGFKNRKEYLNSLADDYGVDVQTVYDLASVLGPDEDFDALVTELEDVAYSQDDDHDGDTEYVGKQFGLTSYYDDKLRGVEDYIELNWGDDPDLEGWIWNKCSQGNYVVLRDWSNGEETKFRPVEEDDIDVKDLIVSKSELFGTSVTESLTEGIELLDSDDLEKYRDTQSQDRDYIGKKLWKDVQSVKELIPEATDEEAALIEKIVKADDEELYRAEDGTIIVAVLSDDDFGYEDAKQYIEDMKFQYEQDPEFYNEAI